MRRKYECAQSAQHPIDQKIDERWWTYWRTELLTTRNGHAQSGWSPIGCEGLCFQAMCKNRVSVSGWSPIGCQGFTQFEHPKSTPYYFSLRLILSATHMVFRLSLTEWHSNAYKSQFLWNMTAGSPARETSREWIVRHLLPCHFQ